MTTLHLRKAMAEAKRRPGTLTWADIERPAHPEPVYMPSTRAFAYVMVFVCGFAAGVGLLLLATGR